MKRKGNIFILRASWAGGVEWSDGYVFNEP